MRQRSIFMVATENKFWTLSRWRGVWLSKGKRQCPVDNPPRLWRVEIIKFAMFNLKTTKAVGFVIPRRIRLHGAYQ